MQIAIDKYKPPIGTPFTDEKFFHCDFAMEKKYFAVSIRNVTSGIVQLFNPQVNIFAEPYATKITGEGITYGNLLQSVSNNAFLVEYIKIDYDLSSQIDYPINVIWSDANGRQCNELIIPRNHFDTEQFRNLRIEVDLRETPILLDGNTYLQFDFGSAPLVRIDPVIRMVFIYRERLLKSDSLVLRNKLSRVIIEKIKNAEN